MMPGHAAAARARIPSGVVALGLVSLLMDTSSELVHSLLPAFLAGALGASAFTIGAIEGAAEATALIVKVVSGPLSDYFGRRKPLAVLGYGLGALSKPLFALATSPGYVLGARLVDRIGKGIRGAPRDALVADLAPPGVRGAAFGLRQALDTVGAFLGPLLAIALMLLWGDDIRAVYWVAIVPGAAAVALLVVGVHEPDRRGVSVRANPLRLRGLRRLPTRYWWVVGVGTAFSLARFSEAFLVLRARQGGLPLAYLPLVFVAMNAVYSVSAYPFGRISDSLSHTRLLGWGLLVLIAADAALAWSNYWAWIWAGVSLWGLHMGMTQGLLATMVADVAPADLRGTAFGLFNLSTGLALLAASTLAGFLWEHVGASATFIVGAGFCIVTLLGLALGAPAHVAAEHSDV